VGLAALGLVALGTSVLSFGGAPAARPASGLRGLVLKGPTAPVCRTDDPCEEPARRILLRFTRAGKVVAEVKTTSTGRYSVRLRAGSYGVKAPGYRIGTGLTPRVVQVPRGRIARVDFHLDTGIQ
jgi:hypothetical protein